MARNFNLRELVASATATSYKIDNTPDFEACCKLDDLIDNILQPLRDAYKRPIVVTSGYRCPKLNSKVGGVSTSQHMKGEAADIVGSSRSLNETRELFYLILSLNLPFDQLICEHDKSGNYWVHVSYRRTGARHTVIYDLLKK